MIKTHTAPSVAELVDFARTVWAATELAEREAWSARIAETGAIPADPKAHPNTVEALKIFATEIGAI